jgi:hypothetical protein
MTKMRRSGQGERASHEVTFSVFSEAFTWDSGTHFKAESAHLVTRRLTQRFILLLSEGARTFLAAYCGQGETPELKPRINARAERGDFVHVHDHDF